MSDPRGNFVGGLHNQTYNGTTHITFINHRDSRMNMRYRLTNKGWEDLDKDNFVNDFLISEYRERWGGCEWCEVIEESKHKTHLY